MPDRRDVWIAAALGLITSLLRLPFVGEILYHWDSINFALALERFDVAAGQPHAPGYPLYVVVCRLVNLILPGPQQALVAISVVGSGLAVATLYLLGVEMFDAAVGFGAALLLASSPLFWFYGEIALPHSLDAFVAIAAVWFFWRIARGERSLLVPAAIWLGIAGGLRPQTQIFLAPLAFYATCRGARRTGARVWIASIASAIVVLLVVDLLWFIPLIQLSGGLERYLQTTEAEHLKLGSTTSILSGGGLWGLRRNGLKLSMYTLYGWCGGLALLGGGVLRRALDGRGWGRLEVWAVLALWMAPSLVFYEFIHMGQQGLVFVFLPALLLASAAAVRPLTGSWRVAAGAAVALNAVVFLFAPTFPLGGDRPKLLTRQTLRQHDDLYRRRFEAIGTRFPPANTAVLSSQWRFPQYYLPQYRLLSYAVVSRWELGEGESAMRGTRELDERTLGVSPDATGARYVLLLDEELVPFDADPSRLEWLDLEGGGRMSFMRLRDGEGLRLGHDSFGIVAAAGK